MTKYVHFETNKGEIVAELFENEAPGTVANFAGLVSGETPWTDPKTGAQVTRPFYDGLTFHRVIPNFVIQGGCPKGNGTGGPGYTIKCETAGNPHKHERGSLSMAHAGKDTGGSQFFIAHSPQPHLDGVHTVFGKVVRGLEVVDAIAPNDQMTRVWIEEA
jgi:peptidyl-prolyl cis-trans isomerase B (cyclophilin B)